MQGFLLLSYLCPVVQMLQLQATFKADKQNCIFSAIIKISYYPHLVGVENFDHIDLSLYYFIT